MRPHIINIQHTVYPGKGGVFQLSGYVYPRDGVVCRNAFRSSPRAGLHDETKYVSYVFLCCVVHEHNVYKQSPERCRTITGLTLP